MIKPCPMCYGRQVNNVFARTFNGPCSYCGGRGQVNTDAVCRCGRPAVQLVKKHMVCTRIDCNKAASA